MRGEPYYCPKMVIFQKFDYTVYEANMLICFPTVPSLKSLDKQLLNFKEWAYNHSKCFFDSEFVLMK